MNRINRIALALMITLSPSSLATEGFYGGIALGNVHAQANVNRTSENGLNFTSNSGKNTHGVGAFVGFNHLIKETPLFVGLEASANSHNMKLIVLQNHGYLFGDKMIAQTKYSLSGVFKAGVAINDFMLYAKAGVFKSQWNVSIEGFHPYAPSYAGKVKTNTYGSVYGFGVDHKLNNDWRIGVDYTVNTSQEITGNICGWTTKVEPVVSMTSLRLTYTF